jgi:hypothetical protein
MKKNLNAEMQAKVIGGNMPIRTGFAVAGRKAGGGSGSSSSNSSGSGSKSKNNKNAKPMQKQQ